jgi:hypothetical protein
MKSDGKGKSIITREASARLGQIRGALEGGEKPSDKVLRAFNSLLRQKEPEAQGAKGPKDSRTDGKRSGKK